MRTDARELLAVGILGSRSRIGNRIEMLLRRGRTFSPHASALGIAASALVLTGLTLAASFAPRWIAFAQERPRPSFEVTSVKPANSSDPASVLYRLGGRFTATSATLRALIGNAYDVREHQISGAPNWIDSARFDIDARAGNASRVDPGPGGVRQMRPMVQMLLAQRFKLALHREIREEPVYELVVDKGGSKLRETTTTSRGEGTKGGKGEILGVAAAIPDLMYVLSQRLGRSVIDKTSLTGKYDFKLTWPPDPREAGVPSPGADSPSASDPSIFAALQEDLGLKLQSARGPVEILVIDHVEMPDAN
jgi:uncharacterized protein (TIGR03435 family)